MAHLALRRSSLARIESLSVVYLAIAYAVLTIALGSELGRIFRGMAPAADEYVTPSTVDQAPRGDLP